jgi:hypothetical protein
MQTVQTCYSFVLYMLLCILLLLPPPLSESFRYVFVRSRGMASNREQVRGVHQVLQCVDKGTGKGNSDDSNIPLSDEEGLRRDALDLLDCLTSPRDDGRFYDMMIFE